VINNISLLGRMLNDYIFTVFYCLVSIVVVSASYDAQLRTNQSMAVV
jgi:hypothetical protein